MTGGVLRHGALPVPPEELPDLERLLLAMRDAAARLDLSRPLAGQDVADLDATPADVWLEELGLPTHTRELALAWFSGTASAMPAECSILEVVRWLAAADNSIWRWLAASVLGHVLAGGTASLVAADRGGRRRGRPLRLAGALGRRTTRTASPCTPEEAHRASIALRPQWSHCR